MYIFTGYVYYGKYSVETISTTHIPKIHTMKHISEFMLNILERLSEMFPESSYQSRLDSYLNTKGITDAAQLDHYIRQFNSHKETFL